jgi:ribosome-associated toxin RatA of RatAB toxin-antitoxin module
LDRRWYALFTLLCLVLPPNAVAADVDVDWQRLFGGEIITSPVRNIEEIPGVQAMFTVTAPRQQIWATLIDYEHFTQIFPDLKEIRVLQQDAQGARVECWVHFPLMSLHYVLYRHYIEPERRLTWARVAGDLERIEGAWEIRDTPQPGVHLLVFKSYVKTGWLLPTSWFQGEALERTRAMGEHLRAWIEGRQENAHK